MAVKSKSYASKRTEYTCTYRDMRGVDFSGSGAGISTARFAYAENMYRDYDGDGGSVIESVPGFRTVTSAGSQVHGIYARTARDTAVHIVIHAGAGLYTFPLSERNSLASKLIKIADVCDGASHAYSIADELYVFDGESITIVSDKGIFKVGDDTEAPPYVPTTYVNGAEYEQRNLLTSKFRERTTIGSCSNFGHGTDNLGFKILDELECTVAVTGGTLTSGKLYIPSAVRLLGKRYSVKKIDACAFRNNTTITELVISDGVEEIGAQAFLGCKNLTRAVTPDSIKTVGTSAFRGCTKLSYVYLGAELSSLGDLSFEDCTALETISYALDKSAFSVIENSTAVSADKLSTEAERPAATIEIPIYTPAESIISVKLGGEDTEHEKIVKNGIVTGILIEVADRCAVEGKELTVIGAIAEEAAVSGSIGNDEIYKAGISGAEAIIGCTVSEAYDGRIFVGGNPKMPNTVFYTARGADGDNSGLYFGTLNYFTDGVGGFSVSALLATSSALAVFKRGDDGSGSIFYHTPTETNNDLLPKIYPVSYVHSGIFATGAAISFYDDPLFVSPLGLMALEKQEINLDRSVVCRSHNVNSRLLSEDLANIRMARWCGYLVLLAGEHIYLADSRARFTHTTGSVEYEWYYLSGIGTHPGHSRIFRYASSAHEGYNVHDDISGVVVGKKVYNTYVDGALVYYTEENKIYYEVYPTEEFSGGLFSPACAVYGIDDLLIFGTKCGDICIFNNDKRGVAPDRIKALTDYSESSYKETMGRKIHPDFYSFSGHAPRYALKTAIDNCGIPHLTKSTVRGSLALKCKTFTASSLTCEVGTDTSGYREVTSFPGGEMNFAEINFDTLSANTGDSFTVPINERERGWIEKQITLYSEDFAAPFGIYSISYRFSVKGKIKKQ